MNFNRTNHHRIFGALSACLIATFGLSPSANAGILHVKADAATCPGDGIGWGTAYKYLQDALDAAALGDQIWVAAGEYFVDQSCANEVGTGDRAETFQLVKGVFLLGGFNGTEIDASERDSVANLTILRGILADVDPAPPCGPPGGPSCFEPHPGIGCENSRCCQAVCAIDPICCLNPGGEWDQHCANLALGLEDCGDAYHVVTAGSEIDDPEQTVIDGFTIRDGTATIALNDRDHGGGILIRGEPSVVRCTFKQNTATARGGGMSINGEFKQPWIINTIFEDNPGDQPWTPTIGGGLAVSQGDPILTNCLFVANASTGNGGAIFTGVGTCQGQGPPGGCGRITLINCTLVSNTADANNSGSGLGGGLYAGGTATIFDIDSCIFWDNLPVPDQVYGVDLVNSAIDFTDVQGGSPVPGTGNIDVIPLFVNAPADLRLTITSLCIDAGNEDDSVIPDDIFDLDNDTFTLEPTPDLDLTNRVLDGDFDGTATVDMGSYEFIHPNVCPCPDICPADLDGSCDVGVKDLLILLGEWFSCDDCADCPADFNGDCDVNVEDLLVLLGAWGPCPCGTGPPPPSRQQAVEDAGLTWPDDWEEFEDVMTDPESSQEDKDNYYCWMNHYLNHCTRMACTTPNCPGAAPFGHHE